MRKSYKYASIVAALSVSGLGGAALVLHDRNVQGTISDDVYWKKIASANKNSNALVADNESVDDLISLADRINSEESSSILSKNATNLVNKAQKRNDQSKLVSPTVQNTVEEATKKDDTKDEVKKEDTSKDTSTDTDKETVVKEGWNLAKTMYYVNGVPVTGLYTIEGQEYYFDDKGVLYTGFLTVDDEDGAEQTVYYKNGIKCYKRTKIGDDYYYFDSQNGYQILYEWVGDRFYNEEGKEVHGLCTINDKQYYFYNDGKLAVGFHTETYNGHKIRCYSNDDIEKDDYGVKQYGIIEVNKKTVKLDTVTGGEYDGEWKNNTYYDEDGETLSGKQTIAGRDMYFKENGEAVFGWYVDSYNNAYYTTPDTGIQAFGLVEIVEQSSEDSEDSTSHIYYFDEDTGISITAGWHKGSDIGQLNGKIYFVAESGKAPYLATGRTVIDGKAYYFDEETGVLQSNMRGDYYTDENGEIQTGEQEVDGKKVFYDDNGQLVNGWYTKDGKTYYYGTNGKAKGKVTIDGIQFEFDEETGELLSKGFIDGLYINDDGSIYYGLKEVDGNTYYFDKNKGGKYATGAVTIPKEYSVSGKATTQYFDENGHQVLGFITISGSTYWYDKNQGRVYNTIITTEGKKYFFAEDGRLFKNGTRKIDNNSKKITSDENGVITKIESMGIENPMLPANDSFEWHAASEYETHSGNPFASPWCTWWAWNRFYEIYGYSPGTHGNGCTNVAELLAAHPDKFKSSDTPVAGAMFSVQPFGSGASASAGHVGIIEKVDGDYIYTSEGGYTSSNGMGVGLKKYTKAEFNAMYPTVTYAVPIND